MLNHAECADTHRQFAQQRARSIGRLSRERSPANGAQTRRRSVSPGPGYYPPPREAVLQSQDPLPATPQSSIVDVAPEGTEVVVPTARTPSPDLVSLKTMRERNRCPTLLSATRTPFVAYGSERTACKTGSSEPPEARTRRYKACRSAWRISRG